MSQAGGINESGGVVPGDVPIDFVTNSGTAVASGNVIAVVGSGGVTTSGSGDTVTISTVQAPTFSAYLTSEAINVTGDGTLYNIIGYTTLIDNKSGFNATTGVYTAPTAGVYLITYTVAYVGVGSGSTVAFVYVNTTTTGYISFAGLTSNASGYSGRGNANGTLLVNMNQGDTVYLSTAYGGSLKNVSLNGGAPVNSPNTSATTLFQGFLIR